MEHGVMIVEACAREEREEGARGEDHQENQAENFQTGLSGLVRPDYPAPEESTSFSRSCTHAVVGPDISIIRPGLSGLRKIEDAQQSVVGPDFFNNLARIIRPHMQTGLSGLFRPDYPA